MSELLNEEFTGITDVGAKFGKREWINQFDNEWSRRLRTFSVERQQVRFIGRVAISTGRIRYQRLRNVYTTVYTHVWYETNGKWQMVSLQDTPVTPPGMK